jgi:2-polyprenyl-3-methyl-5-hydroxy-6-metoxy-1,4-benzoquinol methylase
MRSNRLTVAIEERIAFSAPSRRVRLALAAEVLERHFSGDAIRILDAGCGDGRLSIALAGRHRYWDVTGVDLREDLLERARRLAARKKLQNVSFSHQDLTHGLPAGQYDVVLALECLSEIPDDAAALDALVHAMRPGGLCLVHVPEATWTPILRWSDPRWRHEVRHGYREPELEAALRRSGLERVTIERTYRGMATLAQELRDMSKQARLAVRILAFPVFAAAAGLERRGFTWGAGRALFATGWRQRP